ESDFAALELARTYTDPRTKHLLTPAVTEAIESFFLSNNFQSVYNSENHAVVFWVARFLAAYSLSDSFFEAFGKTGAQLFREDGETLRQFMSYRVKYGWAEFDSGGYRFLVINTLLTLFELSPDPELAKMAGMMVNVLLADMVVDSYHGIYGGARGRVRGLTALQHQHSHLNQIQYLYLGLPASANSPLLLQQRTSFYELLNFSLFSSFRPDSMIVALAHDRSMPYINKERIHLHNMSDLLPKHPLPGSIQKYTYCTEGYLIGA